MDRSVSTKIENLKKVCFLLVSVFELPWSQVKELSKVFETLNLSE